MTDDEFLQPGRCFDSFQLVEKLGEGAMGAVWRATHLKLRRPVAIKFMKREAAKSDNTRNRFLREGEAAARVRHENVVEVHDIGVANAVMPYIVMELLEGEELRQRLRAVGPMPVVELVDLILPVCAAVAAAHDEGIIHRDLKPENIFLARTRDRAVVPKVVDFGISRVSDDASGRVNTHTAALMGTPRYMSPEQVQGAKHVDARSDQYALGVILYEGLVGEPPFNDPVLYNLMGQIVAGQYRLPRALRPDLPEALEGVVRKAMAVYAEHRFPSVRALAQALLPFASERSRHLYADRFVEGTGTLPDLPRPDALLPSSIPPVVAASAPPPDPRVIPETHHATTLGASAREVPTVPERRRRRPVNAVVVTGLAALGLSIAAGTVTLLRPSTPGPSPQGAMIAATQPTPPAAAPPAPVARSTPAVVPAPPRPTVPSPAAVAAPSPAVHAPPPPPLLVPAQEPLRARQILARDPARRSRRTPAPRARESSLPVPASPSGTTAGGISID